MIGIAVDLKTPAISKQWLEADGPDPQFQIAAPISLT